MGMALRGVTHCYRCHKPLADNEFYICNHCKRAEKEEEEKEMMFLESDLPTEKELKNNTKKDIKNVLLNSPIGTEILTIDEEKYLKIGCHQYINIRNNKIVHTEFIEEKIDEVYIPTQRDIIKDERFEYEIKRLGSLALGYKIFIGRKANKDEIEIYMWNSNFTYRWIIASFEYNKETNSYDLKGNEHLKDVQDWIAFGTLVKEGFEILDDFID